MEEINNEIVSKEQEISELMDELSKYICPSQLENLFITQSDLFLQLPNISLSNDNESKTSKLDNQNT